MLRPYDVCMSPWWTALNIEVTFPTYTHPRPSVETWDLCPEFVIITIDTAILRPGWKIRLCSIYPITDLILSCGGSYVSRF